MLLRKFFAALRPARRKTTFHSLADITRRNEAREAFVVDCVPIRSDISASFSETRGRSKKQTQTPRRSYDNGDYYIGQVDAAGLRDGIGHYLYSNGDQYEGDYVNGLRSGFGKYTFAASGEFYEGCFVAGLRNGIGRHVSVSRDSGTEDKVVCGMWEGGKLLCEIDSDEFERRWDRVLFREQ